MSDLKPAAIGARGRAMRLLARLGLRRAFPAERSIGLGEMTRDWPFRQSRVDMVTRPRRMLAGLWRTAAPEHRAIRPIAGRRSRWIIYFVFLPRGGPLDAGHRYTLARLRAADAGLAVICAAPSVGDIPAELAGMVDALYWKALGGFDFSAYALGLHAVASASPGADVLVLNDSTFGPFVPVDDLWSSMQFDLTGFTASGQVENHVQSYAFVLKNVTLERMAALAAIFPQDYAYDDYQAVVLRQETRFAAVAARAGMTVGAWWHADHAVSIDPSLFAAISLVDGGFPFLKRGLFTKHARIHPADQLSRLLADCGHPVENPATGR